MPQGEGGTTIGTVMLMAFFFAVGAIGLLIAAVFRVVNGRIGVGIVLFVIALALGSGAGAIAAYA
jgi:hypothetical protein